MQGFNMRLALTNVLVLACLAVTGQTALAVLGETEAELVKRYGKPSAAVAKDVSAPAEKVLKFTTPAFDVSVFLLEGKSIREVHVLKQNITGEEDPAVARILQANADGERWLWISDLFFLPTSFPRQMAKMKPLPGVKYCWVRRNDAEWRNAESDAGSTRYVGRWGESRAVVPDESPNQLDVQGHKWIDAVEK